MQMLNRYFAPFALLLILSAIFFSSPDPRNVKLTFLILCVSFLVNWWLSANTYRFIHWSRQMKMLQVWLNYVWAVPLVYLLLPFWGPMWLLFVMAPATAALYWGRWQTLATAAVSSSTLLLVYYQRGAFEAGPAEGMSGMAYVHAAFIVVIALFIHGLAQAALRLRDARLG
ncbi:MAG TPA: hypothetical protein DEB40_11140 [Elusimicrobia bacterium]|nr:hypothetical protein [Elusimicrobiota bacterium]HBT62286.1 hypothetical protein [Elusimicrobiota bacterium]